VLPLVVVPVWELLPPVDPVDPPVEVEEELVEDELLLEPPTAEELLEPPELDDPPDALDELDPPELWAELPPALLLEAEVLPPPELPPVELDVSVPLEQAMSSRAEKQRADLRMGSSTARVTAGWPGTTSES
jgi:hypothetical protein